MVLPVSLERLHALPKAEVHVHLEGCFDADQIERLASAAGESMLHPRESLFRFHGLADFLEFLDWTCGLVRTKRQLSEVAYAFSKRMAAGGAGYADAIINPTHWRMWRRQVPELVAALDDGFTEAERDGLPPVSLCISLLRTQSEDEAIELVDLLLSLRNPRVVALSIDGNEVTAGRTGSRFAEAFRRAGAGGLQRTVHAGESSGPEGVRDALDLLRADRIDHGVRAVEDPSLLAELARRQIPLGVCPTSNVTLGLYRGLDEHPLELLRRSGVPVSINTDDPALLGITLVEEYARCVAAYTWADDELRAVARTSIEASFAPVEVKSHMAAELARW